MEQHEMKTAIVTGANSGLGFEASAQLAELGFARVILACRTVEKAEAARLKLVKRTGRDPFETLAIDVADNETVAAAVTTLAERGGRIDFALLNAGILPGKELRRNGDGVEMAMAASLIGHHVLTMGLLNEKLLADDAHIVLAGSEAARGDMPMMTLTDVPEFAQAHFDGDLTKAIVTIAGAEAPYTYKNMPHYAMTKVFLAWWTAALSRRVPPGIIVNAVSPGTALTPVLRNQSFFMRQMMRVIGRIGPLFGAGHSVFKASRRYIDAIEYGPDTNGRFFASIPGKIVGPVVEQRQDHFLDRDCEEAAWTAVVQLSGGISLTEPRRAVA